MFSSLRSTFFNKTTSLESLLIILQLSSTSGFGVAYVVCWLKKNAQDKFNPIKSRTILPKYHKILSSPSSTFCTMTASIESFSVGF